jgi:hypothetical protein
VVEKSFVLLARFARPKAPFIVAGHVPLKKPGGRTFQLLPPPCVAWPGGGGGGKKGRKETAVSDWFAWSQDRK